MSFEQAFAAEMKGAERDFAAFAWELNNLKTFADLGRHPTKAQVDAELERLRAARSPEADKESR